MEPILQFDPANLAVWFVRVPTARKEDDVLTPVARAGLLGDHGSAIERANAMADGPGRVRAGNVLGSVWHEQRHFVDVLLTNYGQATMRHITSVAMNVPPLVLAAKPSGRIGLPLAVYLDEVRRRIVKVDAEEFLVKQAENIRDRELMLGFDHQTVGNGLSIGGRAQLETLGFMTQVSATQHELGLPLAAAIQRDVPDHDRLRVRYQWSRFLGMSLGLVAPAAVEAEAASAELAEEMPSVLAPPICAFLYGTLMIRRWGQEQTMLEGGDSGSAAARFDPLFVDLRRTGALAAASSSEEAWEVVDAACAKVFGRSATEELRQDLACEERFLADFLEEVERESDLRYRYLVAVHEAREALARLFFADPTMFIDPGRYGELLGQVMPVPIFAELKGTSEADPLDPWESLWGYAITGGPLGPQSWSWAMAPTKAIRESDVISTAADTEAWMFFVRDLIPIARLMLYGCRRAPVLGPELEHAEALLRNMGVEPRFDPLYAAPTVDISSDHFWFLTGAASAVCDRCNAPLSARSGHLVPAVAFRKNAALRNWLVEHYGGSVLGEYNALRDWSGWLMCDGCRDELKALGAAFYQPTAAQ